MQGLLSYRSSASPDWRRYGPTTRVETSRLPVRESRHEVSMDSLIWITKKEATGECAPRLIGMNRPTGRAGRANEAGPRESAALAMPVPASLAAVREVPVLETPRARTDLDFDVVRLVRHRLRTGSQAASSAGHKVATEMDRQTTVEVIMASADAVVVSVPVHSSPVFRRAIVATVGASHVAAAKEMDSQAILAAAGTLVRLVSVTPGSVDRMGRMVSANVQALVVRKDLAGPADSGRTETMVLGEEIAALALARSSLVLAGADHTARIGMAEGLVLTARRASMAESALTDRWVPAVQLDRAAIADLIDSAGRRAAGLMAPDSRVHTASRATQEVLIEMERIANRSLLIENGFG